MSIAITDGTGCLLYNTVDGQPVLTEVFESEEQAAAFRTFANDHGVDLRTFVPRLHTLRSQFNDYWATLEAEANA